MTNIIGIRGEDKNPWERRSPLIPSHVGELIRTNGLDIRLQPSAKRIFPDEDFRREGARLEERLSACQVIMAVKEIPAAFLEKNKTYLCFAHVCKGQAPNMPMLQKMMDLCCTLIDYEKITDEKGQRLLFFGTQAGQAGMIDTLWTLGRRLLVEGVKNPFSGIKQTFRYESLVETKEEIAKAGFRIRRSGLPSSLVPLIFGFTGDGRVSLGAQEIFDLLPVEDIRPQDFRSFLKKKNFSPYHVYKVVFREADLVRPRRSGRRFDIQDYYRHPEEYKPVLEPFVPHLTVLVNGIYWTPEFPHFVTKKFMKKMYGSRPLPRLRVIGDISCDVEGGIEVTLHATNPKNPVFVYDPGKDAAVKGFKGKGPVIMAVDNLPAELSLESSVFFSQELKPFIPALAGADFKGSFDNCPLPGPVKRAVVLYQGRLTPDFRFLEKYLPAA
jgi:alpha-aminoadipic semialdehyde synthase